MVLSVLHYSGGFDKYYIYNRVGYSGHSETLVWCTIIKIDLKKKNNQTHTKLQSSFMKMSNPQLPNVLLIHGYVIDLCTKLLSSGYRDK